MIDNIPKWIYEHEPQAHQSHLRPLPHLLTYFVYLISGYHPLGFHLFNLIIHFGNLLAIYALGRLLFVKPGWALLSVVLFAFHPNLQAAIVDIPPYDLLMSFFTLWGLWFWGRFLLSLERRVMWSVLSVLFFVLGLLCKEVVLTFPLLAVSLHLIFIMSGRLPFVSFRNTRFSYLIQLLVLGLYWGYRAKIFAGRVVTGEHLRFDWQILRNLLRTMNGVFYVEGHLQSLNAFLSNAGAIAGSVAALAVIIIGLRPRRYGDPAWTTVFGFVFIFVSVIPLLTFSWVGWWYVYLPIAGVTLGITGLFKEAAEQSRRLKTLAIACCVSISLLLVPLNMSRMAELIAFQAHTENLYETVSKNYGPDFGSVTYIWLNGANETLGFKLYEASEKKLPDGFIRPSQDIQFVMMADRPAGGLLVGYYIHPRTVELKPGDRLFSVEYRDGVPQFSTLNRETWNRVVNGFSHSHRL